MSKQAHTAGPWTAIGSQVFSGVHGNEPRVIIQAKTQNCGEKIPESKANARLIAAAPELLEALKKAYQQCIEFLNEGDFRRKVEWDAGYIVDAIAKAEGRKS